MTRTLAAGGWPAILLATGDTISIFRDGERVDAVTDDEALHGGLPGIAYSATTAGSIAAWSAGAAP